MKKISNFLVCLILLACASQAFAQQPPGPLPVYWDYNGQPLPTGRMIAAPQLKYLRARRVTDGAVLRTFGTNSNNGYNVFVGQGHYTTSPTAVRDQALWIGNPGNNQGTTHGIYFADGTVYWNAFSYWFATFQGDRFNSVPGRDLVVWSSQNSLQGGNISSAQDYLYLLGGVKGLIVNTYRLPAYNRWLGTSLRVSWAWKVEQINVNGHDAFNVYYTGPNPNRWPATTPNGILRVDFYNNTYTWIQ